VLLHLRRFNPPFSPSPPLILEPVLECNEKWNRMVTLTNELPVWLVGKGSEDLNNGSRNRIFFDDEVISPEHAEIKMLNIRGYNRVFVMDKESECGTWVDGQRITEGKQVELKRGMILTFGEHDGMLCGPLGCYLYSV
jgi:pSer/pThr/pTyr-binding forkhead associated (FHA) protein